MQADNLQPGADWSEQDSQKFIDFGRYFVPERDLQIRTICDLVTAATPPWHIVDLCCGEGLLAEALLERFPTATVHGFDRSPTMLERAQTRLQRFGARFQTRLFDLVATEWRTPDLPVQAFVSSLAIHHLDDAQKQQLYTDLYRLLLPGGVLLIADVVQPVDQRGVAVAAQTWDEAVRQRALELDGHTQAYEFFQTEQWNIYTYPDPMDKPSGLFAQLGWLAHTGFVAVDVYWMKAGHAIFGGQKPS